MNEVMVAVKRKEALATGKFPAATNACAILDKFERQENAGKEKKQKVKENKTVKAMQEAFMGFMGKAEMHGEWSGKYAVAHRHVESLDARYSAIDVGNFCISLVRFEKQKDFAKMAGIFVSALINDCGGQDFTICTEQFSERLDFIGYRNTKNIVVLGNAGNRAGDSMGTGRLVVKGDAGRLLGNCMVDGEIIVGGNAGSETGGDMQGGRIVVDGNAREFTGVRMKCGEILVKGDAFTETGWDMEDGKISVGGNVRLAANFKGGNIFQRGRQLVKEGDLVAYPENK